MRVGPTLKQSHRPREPRCSPTGMARLPCPLGHPALLPHCDGQGSHDLWDTPPCFPTGSQPSLAPCWLHSPPGQPWALTYAATTLLQGHVAGGVLVLGAADIIF